MVETLVFLRLKLLIKASKKVILSASVINSPQLLRFSGVAPAAELAEHNIDLVYDLARAVKTCKTIMMLFYITYVSWRLINHNTFDVSP
ncbi:hypothetical protein B5D82_13130 [Cognaticolwellia beringensis]|uniref:Uncharacterized protein n=1 Tax=Cognaticolwellia beringensis TaxID=1967665 RepID=A0A222G9Z4_9GAMM|nr:GMC family oxidoreductase N-terminal domain-containing protein [Cognaticolwellia beringensis]ASP48631.1 hypothetical protein B5D82_13130 [Cognaticolwellia beringensis]